MDTWQRSGTSSGADAPQFWRALSAFAVSVLMTWTGGAVLQVRYPIASLFLVPLFGFALPAGVGLYLNRRGTGDAIFAVPRPPVAALSFGLGVAAVMVAVAAGTGMRQALAAPLPSSSTPGLLLLVGLAVVSPLGEELLYRAVLQRALASVWRPGTAVVATAILYALAHGSLGRFPETFLLGLFSGIVFLKTRSYWACVLFQSAAHLLAPWLWGAANRWPVLMHPLNGAFVAGVALFLAWQLERPQTERVWGFWKHIRWALVGTAKPAVPGGRASARLAMVYWAGVLVMVATMWGLAVLESATVRLAREARQVRQEDVWRLDARGVITVRSRVHYTRWPGRKESVSYALPYTEARVLGARVAGKAVQVRMIGAGTFELVWPERLPELPRVVEVAWAMPIEALDGAERGYVARLQALVPVTAYALGFVLEADSAYEFERAPERRETVLFSILDTGRAPGRSFGTTGIGLRRKAGAADAP